MKHGFVSDWLILINLLWFYEFNMILAWNWLILMNLFMKLIDLLEFIYEIDWFNMNYHELIIKYSILNWNWMIYEYSMNLAWNLIDLPWFHND